MEIGQRRVFFRHDPVQVHNKVPQPQALLKQIFSGTPHVPLLYGLKIPQHGALFQQLVQCLQLSVNGAVVPEKICFRRA